MKYRYTAMTLQEVEAEEDADGTRRIVRRIGNRRLVMVVKIEVRQESGEWEIQWAAAPRPVIPI